jgi:LPXTG-motif cell wall-anchored protein
VKLRYGTAAVGAVAALAAAVLPGGVAAAADPSLSVASVSTPVQKRTDFDIAAVRVHNAGVAVNSVHLRLKFVYVAGGFNPLAWDEFRNQGPCHVTDPASHDPVLDCDYAVSIAAGADADIPVHAFITEGNRPETAPAPRVQVIVGDPATGSSLTSDPVDRTKLITDLTVSAMSPTGAIGDIVDVHVVMKNNGPADAFNFEVGVVAPEGTEIVGPSLQECWTPPRDFTACRPGGFVKSGETYKRTFQLKIKSAGTKPGHVAVVSNWSQGADPDPYFHTVDPDSSNNAGEFHVTIGAAPAHPSSSASGAAPGSGGGELAVTGSNVTPYVALGGALAAVGAALLFLVRRRRVRFTTD